MAKFDSIHLLSFLIFLFTIIKVTNTMSQGTLLVHLENYYEKANDRTTKCIKLCVTTSPSGFPRCNLNTTTGTAIATTKINTKMNGHPDPQHHTFKFIKLQDNSELTITVWKLPTGQTCDTTGPTNSTKHGEDSIIIPRLKQYRAYNNITVADKWRLTGGTSIECRIKSRCLPPCMPRDNSTGHYTCHKGNKKCSTNWFGANCTTFCNESSKNYKCAKDGGKICVPNQRGKDCDCNIKATNYRCDENGRKTCLPNWFNKNCEQFCNRSAGNYICDGEGHRVCLLNLYGKNCTKYCNNSATHYKCNDRGDRVCSRDWYGVNCSKFCDNNDTRFKCNIDGDKICMKNWFEKNCSKFCDNSAVHYKCNDNGDMVCLRGWYGADCSKFCNNNNTRFKCNNEGDKICKQNWCGKNCTKFCRPNWVEVCAKNWYGKKCDIHCTILDTGLYYCAKMENHVGCPEGWDDTKCLEDCENIDNQKVKEYKAKCDASEGTKLLCSNSTATNHKCSYVPFNAESDTVAPKFSRHDVSNVKIYGGLFGSLFLMLIITTIVVVYVSLRRTGQATTTSPNEMTNEAFARECNRTESLTLNIDELMRRRQSSADELGYDNEPCEGMMVSRNSMRMRAVAPFNPISSAASPDEVVTMSNTPI